MASDLLARAVEAARKAQDARWTAVRAAKPEPHARYLVRRGLVGPFVATPCYGLHEPWWVPLIGESKVVFQMRGDDEWRPLPDNEDAELASVVRAVADVLFGECNDRVAAHWPDHPAYSSSGFGYKRTGAAKLLAAQRRELDE